MKMICAKSYCQNSPDVSKRCSSQRDIAKKSCYCLDATGINGLGRNTLLVKERIKMQDYNIDYNNFCKNKQTPLVENKTLIIAKGVHIINYTICILLY